MKVLNSGCTLVLGDRRCEPTGRPDHRVHYGGHECPDRRPTCDDLGTHRAVALIGAPLVHAHGPSYLPAAAMLGGLIQLILGFLRAARLMRFVSGSVMLGFVNALAVLLLIAQLPNLVAVPWRVYPVVAFALMIMAVWHRITTAVPASLVAIIVVTISAVLGHLDLPSIGSRGRLPAGLPAFALPMVPYTWKTVTIIGPYALGIALVGLISSLMTAKLVDDITDAHSSKTHVSLAQGVANIVTGFFGGIGGCGVTSHSLINIRSGARTRLSTFLAGASVLILVVALGPPIDTIPMAALVAVMISVSARTFDWHSNGLTTRGAPRDHRYGGNSFSDCDHQEPCPRRGHRCVGSDHPRPPRGAPHSAERRGKPWRSRELAKALHARAAAPDIETRTTVGTRAPCGRQIGQRR
jgi:hypothetical protein